MSPECTDTQVDSTPEVWQSWGSTLRYVIFCLAQATPTGLLVWLTYLRR